MPSALDPQHGPRQTRLRLGLIAAVGLALASLGVALVAQHRFGMQPCPWCIVQRVILLGVAAAALAGLAGPGRWAPVLGAAGVAGLGAGGVAAAIFQHQVAARDASCALTMADRFLMATGLESALPWLFQVTATCMEAAAYTLLGLGFEVWAGALFGLLTLGAATLLGAALRQR